MILVTGGTGLVGSHLLLELTQKHGKIRATHRKNSNLEAVKNTFITIQPKEGSKLFDMIEWIETDILNYHDVFLALENIQYVYHCAGLVSYDPKDKDKLYETNHIGTRNIINASLEHNIKKLCHVSSVASLGDTKVARCLNEHDFLESKSSKSNYGKSKNEGEQEVWRGIEEGLNAVIINPSIILGYSAIPRSSTQLFSQVKEGLKFYTSGSSGFVDVNDVTNIMIQLMNSDIHSERFIVNGDNVKFEYLFNKIAEAYQVNPPSIKAKKWMSELYWRFEKIKGMIMGKKPLVTKETANSAQETNCYNNTKIRETLNYSFIPIEKSIERIAKYI